MHGAGPVYVLGCGCRPHDMGVVSVHARWGEQRNITLQLAGRHVPFQHCCLKVTCGCTNEDAWKNGCISVVGTVDKHCVGLLLCTTFHSTESSTCAMVA